MHAEARAFHRGRTSWLWDVEMRNDAGQLEPMIRTALRVLEQAGVEQQPDTVLADGGYWNSAQICVVIV